MNFFAHAVLACRIRPDPAFVLGSMLPDLASMAGLNARDEIAGLQDEAVRQGVRLHLRTDVVFHQSPPFRTLLARSRQDLASRGLHRGAVLAVSHLGAELLLDGWLARDRKSLDRFREAVEQLSAARYANLWSGMATPAWQRLGDQVRDGILPARYDDVDFVAQRLDRLLITRPRLRLAEGDAERVADHLPLLRRQLHVVAPELFGPPLFAAVEAWAESPLPGAGTRA